MLNLYNILQEQMLLTEDKASKNIDKAKKYLRGKGFDDPQKIIDALRSDIPHVRLPKDDNGKGTYNFILGAARLFADGQLSDYEAIDKFNKALKYICKDEHINNYEKDLKGCDVNSLYEDIREELERDQEASREESDGKELTVNNNYDIIEIRTPEEASEYGDYTDWCVTHYPEYYWKYTHGGVGVFYFCLKKGFENVVKERGENCPLDEYGLSMIAVSVDSDGNPNTITCRWNHAYGGSDEVMSAEELEEVLGVNFYKTFLPLDEETQEERRENPPEDYDEEVENEEERMNAYYEQRSNDGIHLLGSLYLLKAFDDNYDWDEYLEEYYLYDVGKDDTEPLCWTEFVGEAAVLDIEEDKAYATLRDKRDRYVIVYYEGYEYYVEEDVDDYLVLSNSEVVFLQSGDLSSLRVGRVSDTDLDDLERAFENETLSEEDDREGSIYLESPNPSGAHDLYYFNYREGECYAVIKNDMPINGEFYEFNEQGLIVGEYDTYDVNSEDSFGSIKEYDIVKRLDNGIYLLSIKEGDDKDFHVLYDPKTKKPLFDFSFYKLLKYNAEHGIYMLDKETVNSAMIIDTNGNILSHHHMIQPMYDSPLLGEWDGNAFFGERIKNGTVDHVGIFFYPECKEYEFKQFINRPKNGYMFAVTFDGNAILFNVVSHEQLFPNSKINLVKTSYNSTDARFAIVDGNLMCLNDEKNVLVNNVAECHSEFWHQFDYLIITFIDGSKNIFSIENNNFLFEENGKECCLWGYAAVLQTPSYCMINDLGTKKLLSGKKLNPNINLRNDEVEWFDEVNRNFIRYYGGDLLVAENAESNNVSSYYMKLFDSLSDEKKQEVMNYLTTINVHEAKFKEMLNRLNEARKLLH